MPTLVRLDPGGVRKSAWHGGVEEGRARGVALFAVRQRHMLIACASIHEEDSVGERRTGEFYGLAGRGEWASGRGERRRVASQMRGWGEEASMVTNGRVCQYRGRLYLCPRVPGQRWLICRPMNFIGRRVRFIMGWEGHERWVVGLAETELGLPMSLDLK